MNNSTESPVVIETSSVDELRAICVDGSRTLFAVLDACDEPRVPEKVQELGSERAASLYSGAAQRDYWSFAPYLATVDESLLEWIVENLWDDPWGIFAVSESSLEEVRKHLRKFLLVEGPEGNELYFRFYDPRVLPTYLMSCNRSECGGFYGPVEDYVLSVAGENENTRIYRAVDK